MAVTHTFLYYLNHHEIQQSDLDEFSRYGTVSMEVEDLDNGSFEVYINIESNEDMELNPLDLELLEQIPIIA